MFTLIKNIQVFSPSNLGICDVLIADGRIAHIDNKIEISADSLLNVVEGAGRLLVPGFVDTLVHITGGGGEGGFNTRTPELDLKDAINAGVTSMIGALGTDATTRTLGDLYGKAQSLNVDGLNCYMYTGSYELPAKTITGSVREDIIYIDPVVGVGEVAVSDHRGSQPTEHELARLATDARVGGLLSGKSGIVMIHVGDNKDRLDILHRVHEEFEVSLNHFYPTHVNRTQSLLESGSLFAKQGGTIDLTASTNDHLIAMGDVRASDALAFLLEDGCPANCITFSSDAQGSLPHFDSNGRLDGLDIGSISSLHEEMVRAVKEFNISLTTALSCITKNPAKITGLKGKGEVRVGGDADLLLLEPESLAIDSVMSRGQWLKLDGVMLAKTAFDH